MARHGERGIKKISRKERKERKENQRSLLSHGLSLRLCAFAPLSENLLPDVPGERAMASVE
jgi:hypothetical protein